MAAASQAFTTAHRIVGVDHHNRHFLSVSRFGGIVQHDCGVQKECVSNLKRILSPLVVVEQCPFVIISFFPTSKLQLDALRELNSSGYKVT